MKISQDDQTKSCQGAKKITKIEKMTRKPIYDMSNAINIKGPFHQIVDNNIPFSRNKKKREGIKVKLRKSESLKIQASF